MDARLAPERGLDRLDGQAVALVAAVAAALAHPLVDDDPEVGLRHRSSAAGPALLGRALLIVHQRRDALDLREHLLGLDQPGAVPDQDTPVAVFGRTAAEVGAVVARRILGRDDDPLDAFEEHVLHDVRHRHLALRVLPAGHRDRAVVEQLERDVHAGSAGGAHGQRAGVEVGAVAEVLHDVVAIDERRHADPLRALVAHRGQPGDVADPFRFHQGDHGVAPDAAADERARGNPRRDVVRAAAAVERRAVHGERDARPFGRLREWSDPILAEHADESGAQWGEKLVGIERASAGDQRAALVVAAADDDRTLVPRVQRALHENLERRVLLLDDEHFPQAASEPAHLVLVERDRHRQQGEAHPGAAERLVVLEAEQVECLAQLVVGLAARGDPDPVVGGADGRPVEPVEHSVLLGQLRPHLLELALDVERVRREQPSARLGDVRLAVDLHRRDDRQDAIGVHVDGSGAVGHRRDELVPDPHPARPGECDRVAGEVERLLHVAREHDRHVQVDHRRVARARQRRGLGRGVVADDRDHAAVAGGAREDAVTDRVVGPVEPGRLAVPEAEHAVVLALRAGIGELAAHHRGGCELLVHAGPHDHGKIGDRPGGAAQLLLQRAHGRALVPGRKRGRVQPVAAVDAQLIDRQPSHGLHA